MALMVAGCGSESTPSAPSPALAAGEILYAPPGAGLVGATTFTFTARGFGATNGEGISYEWDFGDGTSAESGANAFHLYESTGVYLVSVVAISSRGLTASARMDGLTVVSLSGLWGLRDGSGRLLAGSTYLTQDGPALRGTQIFDCPYDVRGTIVMPRSIRINWSRRWPECGYGESAYYGIDFTGTADEGFTVFTGEIGYQPGARLVRCAGPSDCP
jgi:PKD repeat protein